MIEKVNEINELLDSYENLLTEKQLDIVSLYYREDLSYQEIADNLSITKSAVYDTIKKVESILSAYESKIGMVRLEKQMNQFIKALLALGNDDVNQLVENYQKERK